MKTKDLYHSDRIREAVKLIRDYRAACVEVGEPFCLAKMFKTLAYLIPVAMIYEAWMDYSGIYTEEEVLKV